MPPAIGSTRRFVIRPIRIPIIGVFRTGVVATLPFPTIGIVLLRMAGTPRLPEKSRAAIMRSAIGVFLVALAVLLGPTPGLASALDLGEFDVDGNGITESWSVRERQDGTLTLAGKPAGGAPEVEIGLPQGRAADYRLRDLNGDGPVDLVGDRVLILDGRALAGILQGSPETRSSSFTET